MRTLGPRWGLWTSRTAARLLPGQVPRDDGGAHVWPAPEKALLARTSRTASEE